MVGSFAQSKEAVFVYLAVYSVFVPIFQIHHLTMAMLLLTGVQMALFVAYGLVNNAGERETYKNMLALEAYIAVILNMLGVGIAHLADPQTRSNVSRAKSVARGHTVALAQHEPEEPAEQHAWAPSHRRESHAHLCGVPHLCALQSVTARGTASLYLLPPPPTSPHHLPSPPTISQVVPA